jgi:hypothetical protein
LAVGELFAKRLDDFGVFYRYLKSPEYVGTTLHGSTRQEQFSQYLQAQQEQVSINQIRQEILGNQTATTPNVPAQTQNIVSLPKDQTSTNPSGSSSKTELVALVLLLQKLKSNDLIVSKDQLQILDIATNQFEILQATFISQPDLTVAFELNTKTNVVSRVRVLGKNGDQNVSGEFLLENLANQIKGQPLRVKRK